MVTFSNVVRSESRTNSAGEIRSFDAGTGDEGEVTGVVAAPEDGGRRFTGPELPLDVGMRCSFEDGGWERVVVRRSGNEGRADVEAAGEAIRWASLDAARALWGSRICQT